MSRFGFSTEASTGGGDFLPIVKFDARAGLFFRVDRVDTGSGFENHPTDITTDEHGTFMFRAVFDLENLETGWIDFTPGSPPSFILVRMADLDSGVVAFPDKPAQGKHKPGIRFMIKLSKDIADSRPIREMASTAKAFVNGISDLYKAYEAGRQAHPGELPVVELGGKAIPVKTGSGDKASTNYQPRLKIVRWAPRGDLKPVPRGTATANGHAVAANGAAPSTGSTQRAAPQGRKPVPQEDDLSDFG